MTSSGTFPSRLLKVDKLALPDHWYLSEDDICFYIGEYTAQKGYKGSDTNQLITNFKKRMDQKGKRGWHYKGDAIQEVAAAFRAAIGDSSIGAMTFVPVPPSKAKDDPMYDDRLTRMLKAMNPDIQVDIREIVVQETSTLEAHLSDERPRPEDLIELYSIDESLAGPTPDCIAIVDDMLTTGSHFKAMQTVLTTRFPSAYVIGLFIARRVPNTDDPEDFDD